MGLHPPCPLLQYTPFKFENLIDIAQNHSNLGILVLSKIKYPIASGVCITQTPCLRDTILELAPPPISTPDSNPPSENPRSAPEIIVLSDNT